MLLTSPYQLPLCFCLSPPASPPPPLPLITAVSKKLQEKYLPQREKPYELLIYSISGLYIEKSTHAGVCWVLHTFTSSHQANNIFNQANPIKIGGPLQTKIHSLALSVTKPRETCSITGQNLEDATQRKLPI